MYSRDNLIQRKTSNFSKDKVLYGVTLQGTTN